MSKPECDFIKGIPPAIAIEQKVTSRNPRSTVGTSTEIYEYLRLLFARGRENVFSRKRATGKEGQCGRHRELHAVLPEGHTLHRTDTYPFPVTEEVWQNSWTWI